MSYSSIFEKILATNATIDIAAEHPRIELPDQNIAVVDLRGPALESLRTDDRAAAYRVIRGIHESLTAYSQDPLTECIKETNVPEHQRRQVWNEKMLSDGFSAALTEMERLRKKYLGTLSAKGQLNSVWMEGEIPITEPYCFSVKVAQREWGLYGEALENPTCHVGFVQTLPPAKAKYEIVGLPALLLEDVDDINVVFALKQSQLFLSVEDEIYPYLCSEQVN